MHELLSMLAKGAPQLGLHLHSPAALVRTAQSGLQTMTPQLDSQDCTQEQQQTGGQRTVRSMLIKAPLTATGLGRAESPAQGQFITAYEEPTAQTGLEMSTALLLFLKGSGYAKWQMPKVQASKHGACMLNHFSRV